MNKIRVLIVEPNKESYQIKIEHTLKNLQKIVGGYIEILQLDYNTDLVCNDEGKINRLPLNRFIDYDIIAGTFIIAGHKDSETISLSRKQIKKYKEIFRLDTHQKYMRHLFHNSRDEQFLKEVDKYGLLKTIKKHIN